MFIARSRQATALLIVGEVRLRLNVGEAVLAPSLPPAGSPAIEDDRGRRHSLSPTL